VAKDYATKGEMNDTKTSLSSSIEETATEIKSTVSEQYATKDALSGVDGRVTTVSQTVEGLETTVSGNNGLTTIIRQDSNGVTVGKKDANGNYTTSRSVVGSDGTFKVIDKSGRTLASYGSDIRLLPEPPSGTSTSKIYIAGDNVHNAGVIRGDFNTGDEDGNLSIRSTRWLTLLGDRGATLKAKANDGNDGPSIDVDSTGVSTNGVFRINNTHNISGVWLGTKVLYEGDGSVWLMKNAEFKALTGYDIDTHKFVVVGCDGDGPASGWKMRLTFQLSSEGVGVLIDGTGVVGSKRINYIIVRFG
jgi:hypothetical protein